MQYPEEANNWYKNSNSIVFLSIRDEEELQNFCNKLTLKNLKYSKFHEPDLNNQLTAICIEPSAKTRKTCFNLKLALK